MTIHPIRTHGTGRVSMFIARFRLIFHVIRFVIGTMVKEDIFKVVITRQTDSDDFLLKSDQSTQD